MTDKKPKKKKTPKSKQSPPNAKGKRDKIEKPKTPSRSLIVSGPVYGELNPKQIKFCHEYVKDFNATQAAIRAGYSKNNAGQQGYETLKNPKVQELCTHLIEKQLHTAEVTDDWIIGTTREIVESTVQQTQEAVMRVDPETGEPGAVFISLPADSKSALKGLELLAKIKGMLKENMHHTGQMTMSMSPAEHAAKMKAEVKARHGRTSK